MSTKTLLFAAAILIFLAGWAFGYGINDIRVAQKAIPATEREEILTDKLQTAQRSTTNPGDNFRVAIVTAAHDYSLIVSAAVRAVARGGDSTAVIPATDARVTAVAAPFETVLPKSAQTQHQQLWQTLTGKLYDYGAAKAANDAAALSTAADSVNAATGQLVQFYTAIGVPTSVAALQAGFSRAISKIEQSINMTDGDTLAVTLENDQRAAQELGSSMDIIATDLVKTFPNQF